ncbi:MAG: radical SAM protein [Candidatus Brockarchaeota archaeon]|nr:radical SAM protein [Candidatus Brockarchaeota archaeon]
MGRCLICGVESPLIAGQLGVCLKCIRRKPEEAVEIAKRVHEDTRRAFGLPHAPPGDPNGLPCGVCANDCRVKPGEKGFCGLVLNTNGRLTRLGGTREMGLLEWYYDPLPTNCVASWFCPGCTGAGYPKYAYKPGVEEGYVNLAVFYGSCSFDCLFCQNWHFRQMSQSLRPLVSSEELASKADRRVSCVCFFGGDPSTQMMHALETSRIALQRAEEEKRILRICWETNGNMSKGFALKAAELSLKSGGVVKFDLKMWDENLSRVLCGVSNRASLNNFREIGERFFKQRPEVPVLTASTLLIPGYVDAAEVENIARFIAEVNPGIPYTLLAFYPQYVMDDLPTTSWRQARECYEAARKHLEKVRIGNLHLLSGEQY